MAGSINKVILVGNLGRDPEIRSTQDGREIANLALATSESWKDRNTGEKREKTEWHRIVIFNEGLVNVVKNYVKKGSKLYIEGQLQTRKWEDASGQERYSTEIVLQGYGGNLTMLDSAGGAGGGSRDRGDYPGNAGDSFGGSSSGSSFGNSRPDMANADIDDDIPF